MLKIRRHLPWLCLSFFIIVIDQLSKWWVIKHLPVHTPVKVNAFFNWYVDFNTGAAFSLLSNHSGWQLWLLSFIATVISIIIVIWLQKPRLSSHLAAAGLACILGGALGNVIDRLWHQKVTDFISWHIGHYYWPTFNIADSAVCLGALLFILGNRDDHKTQ